MGALVDLVNDQPLTSVEPAVPELTSVFLEAELARPGVALDGPLD